LGGESVEVVKGFKYLGSLIEAHGGMTGKVIKEFAQASKVIGELLSSVFLALQLIYQSVVLGVLVLRPGLPHSLMLESWRLSCVKCVHSIGTGKSVQWTQHITTIQLTECFGVCGSIGNMCG